MSRSVPNVEKKSRVGTGLGANSQLCLHRSPLQCSHVDIADAAPTPLAPINKTAHLWHFSAAAASAGAAASPCLQ